MVVKPKSLEASVGNVAPVSSVEEYSASACMIDMPAVICLPFGGAKINRTDIRHFTGIHKRIYGGVVGTE